MKYLNEFITIAVTAFFVGLAAGDVGDTYNAGIYEGWLPLQVFLFLLSVGAPAFMWGRETKE